jgi:DNA-binding transcriptional regulator YiaG
MASTTQTLPRPPRKPKLDQDGAERSEVEAALGEGLRYLSDQLDLSAGKLAKLLRVSRNTISNWLSEERVPVMEDGTLSNEAECLVNLIAIHKNLEAMFEIPEAEKEWLNLEHDDLNGKPIELIAKSIEGTFLVRKYLDYARGRGA